MASCSSTCAAPALALLLAAALLAPAQRALPHGRPVRRLPRVRGRGGHGEAVPRRAAVQRRCAPLRLPLPVPRRRGLRGPLQPAAGAAHRGLPAPVRLLPRGARRRRLRPLRDVRGRARLPPAVPRGPGLQRGHAALRLARPGRLLRRRGVPGLPLPGRWQLRRRRLPLLPQPVRLPEVLPVRERPPAPLQLRAGRGLQRGHRRLRRRRERHRVCAPAVERRSQGPGRPNPAASPPLLSTATRSASIGSSRGCAPADVRVRCSSCTRYRRYVKFPCDCNDIEIFFNQPLEET